MAYPDEPSLPTKSLPILPALSQALDQLRRCEAVRDGVQNSIIPRHDTLPATAGVGGANSPPLRSEPQSAHDLANELHRRLEALANSLEYINNHF